MLTALIVLSFESLGIFYSDYYHAGIMRWLRGGEQVVLTANDSVVVEFPMLSTSSKSNILLCGQLKTF